MSTKDKNSEASNDNAPVWMPTESEAHSLNHVMKDFITGRNIMQKGYNQFNGRNLYDCIDDWTKRWNGYVPESSDLLEVTQSRIFLNYTRNAIISYLSKVAMNVAQPKISAINRKNNINNKRFAELVSDLNKYSLNAEQGEARFLETALEVTTKGTAIVYEGYLKLEEEIEIPLTYDIQEGKLKTKKETKTVFDNCYQKIVPIEDFYISNVYEPDIQKQPFLIWRQLTSFSEAKSEYGHYPNFEYVKPGSFYVASDPATFYRNQLTTELGKDQVEILRYYNRHKNKFIVIVNGIVMIETVIPFKNGKYPFARYIFEPFGNDFFYGAGFPNKIQGEQDLKNMFWNMMVDKTTGSLLPFGLTSDIDDLIDDDRLELNKIRKVGDINKWRFETLPGVSAGEVQMLQLTDKYLSENSGDVMGGGAASSPRGGKLPARQILLKQQEAMSKMGFSMNFLEDGERDRTDLRVSHILQFYSIPKIEKISGKKGDEITKLSFRDIIIPNSKLSDGQTGNKVIKLVSKPTAEEKAKIADELSTTEVMGEETGNPTEAIAMDVDSFSDYNLSIEIVKNSSYEKNHILDQSSRMEFANWRIGLAQVAPVNASELVKWVEESYDIDTERFTAQQPQGQPGQPQPGQPAGGPLPQGSRPASELTRTDNTSALAKATS